MEHTSPLDLSAVDPVDVVMLVARKAQVAAPDGARAWLAAPAPAPRHESAAYRRFLSDLRGADVGDVFRNALEAALDSARGDTRLADLLGQATPALDAITPPAGDTPQDRGGTEEAESTDELIDVRDAESADAPAGDWYEAPADDAIGALLAVARRSGIAVPDGARAWLSAPPPAPFDESWAYRSMLTALTVAPVSADLRAAINDALARARSHPGRLADLLGTRAADAAVPQPDPAGPPTPEHRRDAPARGGRDPRRIGPRPPSPRPARPARPARPERPARPARPARPRGLPAGWAGTWRRRIALAIVAIVVGVAAAWVALQAAPALREHLPTLGDRPSVTSPEDVASEVPRGP